MLTVNQLSLMLRIGYYTTYIAQPKEGKTIASLRRRGLITMDENKVLKVTEAGEKLLEQEYTLDLSQFATDD